MIGGRLRAFLAAAVLVLLCAPIVNGASGYSQTIYRSDAFSTQATSYYCTAAVVQNIMNLAAGTSRRDRTQQAELYAFGRANNLFDYDARGVDPAGLEATLEAYVPGIEWRQVMGKSLQGALRAAARGMRRTGLPAVLFVGGGRHVWTMNGYTATADPASGRWFRVTHVRFSGPYYPKLKAWRGWFDLRPNTGRSVGKLAEAFFPYKNRLAFGERRRTPWRDYWVAVVPWRVDVEPDPEPTPTPTPSPTPEASPSATPDTTPDPTQEPATQPSTSPS